MLALRARPQVVAAAAAARRAAPSPAARPTPLYASRVVPWAGVARCLSDSRVDISKLRNIGISAHIDSGKTTLTERILFYTGKIRDMHEVKGKDGVGATMDHMDLEREKGITIQSAATFCKWQDHHINIIDTPGHVDFTIEVERSLRVLDGAIMVLCAVGGVQSQSITVHRQMMRYGVPRLTFINKLDRTGGNPWTGIEDMRKSLGLNAAAVQIPIGAEQQFSGIVDIIERKAFVYEGDRGRTLREVPIPSELEHKVDDKRHELIEKVADVDEELADYFMSDKEPPVDVLRAAIRRQTIALKFVPVFMGSAYKNKGVQNLLDGVLHYLPNPRERKNYALDQKKGEEKVLLEINDKKPLVSLAFKLEEGRYGQLTYLRTYQGTLRKGDTIFDVARQRKFKVPRLVRMHANSMEDITEAPAGEIVALFGIECDTGTTFTDGSVQYTMSSMFVPDPVMSLSIQPKDKTQQAAFSKALNRFQREDPTFRVHFDTQSKETIISGMGELHLEIYSERMRREYGVDTIVGKPKVSFRETCTRRANFSYLHKKQSGGAGQFGRVDGYLEPLPADHPEKIVIENQLVGSNIPPEFGPAIEKGFREACEEGPLLGHPVQGVRIVFNDGASHVVDSNEQAFRAAAKGAFVQGFKAANPIVLEPVMNVEVSVPSEFQSNAMSTLNRRRAMIQEVEVRDGGYNTIRAGVPLNAMFGYSTDIRSQTEGKGEFTMEFSKYAPVPKDEERQLVEAYQRERMAAAQAAAAPSSKR